jgi:hypothetical protein
MAALVCSALLASTVQLTAKDAKLKPEEVVAKHLESLGMAGAIAAIKTRATAGTAQVIFRLPSPGQIVGKGNIFSEGRKLRIQMTFGALEYPAEQLAFDGEHVTVSQVRPGQRSNLGSFIYQYDMLMKEGLLGGAMTSAWALLDTPGRQPKLEYTGLKKVDGKQVHEMKYRAKKGAGDLQVSLYFDPETFRHVCTISKLIQPASMGRSPAESSGQRDTLYQIKEDYSDFKEEDSVTFPHAYKLVYTMEGQSRTVLVDYNMTIEQVSHNQKVDPKYFSVQ